MSLSEYIETTISLPWQWGVQDCTMWVADWCIIRWGFDPAALYRGRYSTELEAEEILRDGLTSVISPSLSRLEKKDVSDDGDIGVIDVIGRKVSAIKTGPHWAFRNPRGIGFTRQEATDIWG